MTTAPQESMKGPPKGPQTCIIAAPQPPAKEPSASKLTSDSQFLPMHHISVGDLLRGMGPSSPDINAHIAHGTVLPGSQIIPIIAAHMSNLPPHSPQTSTSPASIPPPKFTKILLLDGFPRNLEQEELARKPLASDPETEFPDLVVYFSFPREDLKRRYVQRRRGEDDAALFEKRYEQHERECPAVVERYKERGILVVVDTAGDMDESYREFVKMLKSSPLGQGIVRE